VGGGRTYDPLDKLLRGAVTFDGNTQLTNFVGHPLSGAFYYQVARGNRLSTAGSALMAFGASAVWELTEFHETASINDQIVTPAAGVAIGEPLVQLSAFFEQRDAGPIDRALAWALQPFKPVHDLWDGARAARRPEALAWHAFRLSATGGAVRRGGGWVPVAGAGVEARLVRAPAYGAPGRGARPLLDGHVTRLALEAAGSRDGLEAARFESEALLAAVYWRDLAGATGAPGEPGEGDGGVSGQDLLAGLGVGFEHGARRVAAGPIDWRSLVHLPAGRLAWRRLAPGWRVEASLAAAPVFGGVRSLVLAGDPAAVAPADLTVAARSYGYFFAWGAALRPALEVQAGPVALGVEGRLLFLRGLTARDPDPLPGGRLARLADRGAEARGFLRWAAGGPTGLALGVEGGRTWREGRAGEATRRAAASDLLLTLSLPR